MYRINIAATNQARRLRDTHARSRPKGTTMSARTPLTLARFVAKLERRAPLPDRERAALLALPVETRRHDAARELIREGERPWRCSMVESGVISSCRILRDGSRQILSFHLPGDMVDLQSALMPVADRSAHALSAVTIVSVAQDDLMALAVRFPAILRALWFDTLTDAAIQREWTINVGRRTARARTAHLLLEFASRMEAIGLLVDDSFEFPITQAGLADALGLTHVHTNRMVQWLRSQHYIRTVGRMVTIENWAEMRKLSGFDRAYLHPEGPRAGPAA